MSYWLFKSEPETWSWDDQTKRGKKGEPWDGVRNHQANNFMKDMKVGDLGFFYHSGKERRIVGIVEVVKEWYLDPTDASGKFGMVDVTALGAANDPVGLDKVKADERLSNMVLVKNPRLSVQPVTLQEWDIICDLAGLAPPPHAEQK